jgi:TatD DNase family protein
MLETDCPYLAPVPYRGRRNEPAYVTEVCRALAEVKGWSYEETAQRTTDAFFSLFQKARRD